MEQHQRTPRQGGDGDATILTSQPTIDDLKDQIAQYCAKVNEASEWSEVTHGGSTFYCNKAAHVVQWQQPTCVAEMSDPDVHTRMAKLVEEVKIMEAIANGASMESKTSHVDKVGNSGGAVAQRELTPGVVCHTPADNGVAHMEAVHDMLEQAAKHHFNEYWAGLRRRSLVPEGIDEKEELSKWQQNCWYPIRDQVLSLLPASIGLSSPATHLPPSDPALAVESSSDMVVQAPLQPGGQIAHLRKQLEDKNKATAAAALWKKKEQDGRTIYIHEVSLDVEWNMPRIVAQINEPSFQRDFERIRMELRAAIASQSMQQSERDSRAAAAMLYNGAAVGHAIKVVQPLGAGPGAPQRRVPDRVPGVDGNQPPPPDFDKMVVNNKVELDNAVQSFHDIVGRKGLSTHAATSYHVTFGREVISENMWTEQMGAMGITFQAPGGLPEMITVPYAVPCKSNPYVPGFRLIYQVSPERHLTVELNKKQKKLMLKGGRGIIIDNLVTWVSFFGPVIEINAQQAAGSQRKTITPRTPSVVDLIRARFG